MIREKLKTAPSPSLCNERKEASSLPGTAKRAPGGQKVEKRHPQGGRNAPKVGLEFTMGDSSLQWPPAKQSIFHVKNGGLATGPKNKKNTDSYFWIFLGLGTKTPLFAMKNNCFTSGYCKLDSRIVQQKMAHAAPNKENKHTK